MRSSRSHGPSAPWGKLLSPEWEATSVHTGLTSLTLRASCSKQVRMCPLPIGPLPPARQRRGLCQVPRESPWPASPVVKGRPRATGPRIQDVGAGPVLRDSAALAPPVSMSSTKGAPGRYPGLCPSSTTGCRPGGPSILQSETALKG